MFKSKKILNQINNINRNIEKIIEYQSDRKKFILNNLLSGIIKGIGISIGVFILGSILIMILKELITLPIVGKYIAEIVHYVDVYLDGKK